MGLGTRVSLWGRCHSIGKAQQHVTICNMPSLRLESDVLMLSDEALIAKRINSVKYTFA
jgi:hypothetical protein